MPKPLWPRRRTGAWSNPFMTPERSKIVCKAAHVVDGGYTDADAIVMSRTKHNVVLCGPVALENSWQARAADAFDLSHFHIDWQNQQVTCPTGQHSYCWTLTKNRSGQGVI